jgi:hypothetical protein
MSATPRETALRAIDELRAAVEADSPDNPRLVLLIDVTPSHSNIHVIASGERRIDQTWFDRFRDAWYRHAHIAIENAYKTLILERRKKN